MPDSTTDHQQPSPRRGPAQPRPNAFKRQSPSSVRRPVLPPQHAAPYQPTPAQLAARTSAVPETPPLSAEELYAAQYADTHQPQFLSGYDPGAQRVVPSDPEDNDPDDGYEVEDAEEEYDDDDDDDQDEGDEHLAVEMDEGDEDSYGEQSLTANPWDDGEPIPPPPPTVMPVKYSRWLDLGDVDDRDMAQTYRGWKIKIRTDLSLDFLSAAEALQDAARAAKQMERRSRGRVRAEVRIGHIRAVLSDVLVAWNYVDERGLPLPQPQDGGLGRVRGDLLAATLNRAIMAVVPGKKRLRGSTPR